LGKDKNYFQENGEKLDDKIPKKILTGLEVGNKDKQNIQKNTLFDQRTEELKKGFWGRQKISLHTDL